MKVPFNDLKAQYDSIRDEVTPAINKVLDNSAFILGQSVADFETAFAKAHDVDYCIGLSSGTAGNHVALWALGIGPGDEVIVPANTFVATAWGVTLCGATPVFVDCEPDSHNLDVNLVEQAITEKTRAIVAVHLYGQPADMDSLREIANRRNLFLVEDAAQAHIAEYNGKKVGGLGDVASFSFYPGKNLGAFGEAGAVTTNDPDLAQKMKMLREHGAKDKYRHEIAGHNYRMEGIQGAVLGVKLKHLEKWTQRRRQIAEQYRTRLSSVDGMNLPVEMVAMRHVYHLFVVNLASGERRDQLRTFLAEQDVATGLHYPVPLHLQPCFHSLGYSEGDFENAEALAFQSLSLPIYPEMSDEQVEYVANCIERYFNSLN